MLFEIVVPIIMYVVTSTIGFTLGTDTHTDKSVVDENKTEKSAEKNNDQENKTHGGKNIKHKGESSVEIKEGGSSVVITLDNKTSHGSGEKSKEETFDFFISEFQYPGSTIIESKSLRMVMQSSDSPEKVTKWYEERIKQKGMNTTSFVKTSTNGRVLNKLGGANGSEEVLVEISAKADSNVTEIVVTSK